MRGVFYVLSALAIIGLAYWAYRENYHTQKSLAEVRVLQREIGSLREALSVQRAEWAYLNRPIRLRELADINYERLGLDSMRPEQFGIVEQVAFPVPGLPGIDSAVDLTAEFANEPELGEAAQ